MSVKVETIPADLYTRDFLSGMSVGSGTVCGILGRLKHEPEVAEGDDSRFIYLGSPKKDDDPEIETLPRTFDIGHYKSGVSPSERVGYLKTLYRLFNPYADDPEVKILFEAVESELSEDNGIDMRAIVAKEEEVAKQQAAKNKEDSARYELQRLEREREREAAEQNVVVPVNPNPVCECGDPTCEQGCKFKNDEIEIEDEDDEEIPEEPIDEIEMGECELCNAEMPKDDLNDFEGLTLCANCTKGF